MAANNCTCKIPISNSNSTCIVNTEWLNSEINVLVLHDNQAWNGKLELTAENENITELLDQLSLSRDTYLEELRRALTTHNGANSFTYTLENGKFTWKKIVRRNMSVKFGNINLSKVPLFETFEKVLDSTLQSNLTLMTNLQNSDNLKGDLEKENHNLQSKLNDLIEKKNEMEQTLYSQFLHLLNEKKKRIKELKRKISYGNKNDLMQSDESNHFDSDTEIDSEEEEKLKVSKLSSVASSHIGDEHVSPSKRSRQENRSESLAGPSGVKNNKKVPTLNGRKGQKKSFADSCVFGQKPKVNDNHSSEASEDVFLFKTQSKKSVTAAKILKPSSSKIKYESDDETNLRKSEEEDNVSDKTPSQIDQVEIINENGDLEVVETKSSSNNNPNLETLGEKVEENVNKEANVLKKNSEVTLKKSEVMGANRSKNYNQENVSKKVEENIMKEDKFFEENSKVTIKSEVIKTNSNENNISNQESEGKTVEENTKALQNKSAVIKKSTRGLSSSTLDILNQLI